MFWRILAIPVIILGIAGLVLPVVPGIALIAVGLFMLFKGEMINYRKLKKVFKNALSKLKHSVKI